jgi:hypothetical protein
MGTTTLMSARDVLGDVAAFTRYAGGLRPYLNDRLDLETCRRRITEDLGRREENLVAMLRDGVFAAGKSARKSPRQSPYQALFAGAGITFADAVHLVEDHGVEGALERLHGAGVYVTLDEFKGRRPIERGNVRLEVRPEDFDNPRAAHVYTALSGGSRGPARRLRIAFPHLERAALYTLISLQSFGIADRPYALWRPVPPGNAGLRNLLHHAKIGKRVERWFTQYPLRPRHVREYAFTRYTLAACARAGIAVPTPEHVPLERAEVVARWLAGQRENGTPAALSAPASSGVRICRVALERGLDISGSVFRLGGEPLTEGKASAVAEAGASVFCNYTMSETGRIGLGCTAPAERDDVHLLLDNLGVIQRPRDAGGGIRVPALLYTSLQPSAPKLLLNVESDDYGVLVERDCGCPVGALGLRLHLHTIRSYEKLTSEGMNFVGTELLTLVEQVLPSRFGGGPADYQLVEREVGGLPKVGIVVSPRIGALDEGTVVSAVLDALGSGPAYREMMAAIWRDGGTLQVERREPFATSGAKILPLHIIRDS